MDRLLTLDILPSVDGEEKIDTEKVNIFLKELGNEWNVVEGRELSKNFTFKNFVDTLDFVNKVGEYAEKVDHHPEITFTWGKAIINIYTHSVGGLREADFAWAANVELIYSNMIN